MRNLFIVLVLGSVSLCVVSLGICDSLDDAGESANTASNYADKAQNPANLKDAQYRSRQTVSATSEAKNAALDAKSYRAADYEGAAYDYSRKAASAKSVKDAQFYSRQAAKAANNARSTVDYDINKRKKSTK